MCASGYRTPRSTSRIYMIMIATVKYGNSILEPGYFPHNRVIIA